MLLCGIEGIDGNWEGATFENKTVSSLFLTSFVVNTWWALPISTNDRLRAAVRAKKQIRNCEGERKNRNAHLKHCDQLEKYQ